MKYFAKLFFYVYRHWAHKKVKQPESNMTVEELLAGLFHSANIATDYGCFPHFNSSNGSSQWTSGIVEYLREVTDGEFEPPSPQITGRENSHPDSLATQ